MDRYSCTRPVVGVTKSAFRDRTNLTSITIPNSVQFIEKGSFFGCNNLSSISLPFVGGKPYDPNEALEKKEKIAEEEGETIENIFLEDAHFGYIFDADAYETDDSKQGEYLPKSLKTVIITGGTFVENAAFAYCNSLETIILPDTLTKLSYGIFGECESLTSVTLPKNLKVIEESAFISCIALKSINIPLSVEIIKSKAFTGCGFTSIELHNGIKEIQDMAFLFCEALKKVTLPASLESIGFLAFSMCASLEEIVVKAVIPPVFDSTAFFATSKGLIIYVPQNAVNDYKVAEGWKEYENIIYPIPQN